MEPNVNVELSQEELLKQAQEVAEANASRSPEEIAANFFAEYYPSYKILVEKLNRKDAVRLADALVAWPLEIQTPKFADNDGYNAFRLALPLIDCKMIMRNAVEMENMQNAIDNQSVDLIQSTEENEVQKTEGETENG